MQGHLADYIGASVVATLLTFYGWYFVLQVSVARGERAGLFAALGLTIGLAVFGAFPLADIALRLLHLTQYYQYVRIVLVILALLAALTFILNYRERSVVEAAGAPLLFWVFLLALLIHLITPLPYEFYENILTHGGWLAAAGQIREKLTGAENPFVNPLRSFTLPVVAFVVYLPFVLIGRWLHRIVIVSDTFRIIMMVLAVAVFIGVAIWVGYKGVTYDVTLLDKITNFGLQRIRQ